MRAARIFVCSCLALASLLLLSGCNRNPGQFWDDTKSCGRHVSRGVKTLGGKHGDSRMVCSKNQFIGWEEDPCGGSSMECDYVPLADRACQDVAMAEFVAPQPKESPGDPGSSVPGIDAFRNPATVPGLAAIFRNIQFEYNSNLIKGEKNLATIKNVAGYLRNHPDTYIFVEGHCDERGPQAYNLALGARRSNAVRNMLIQEGVSPDRIFTVSYGKERPLVTESNEEAWAQNRRAEFKIYQR